MTKTLSVLQCALRVALAAILGYTVAGEFFRTDAMQIGWYISPRHVGLTTALLCTLLATVSIWLLFGVRTRIVALMGLALYIGLEVVNPGLNQASTDTLLNSAFVVLLALPLVIFGGGKFSMLRAGWRGAI
ncbi:hypothetical protein M4578_04560 [Salipiger sp. P9]|uniref:hypothetical protein n=1 Tax=Salipiger pentaromativorans TaxID=2943193 RepID=UPI0021578B8F|nr:hypothetical protein [Salipiger pentaromativorans]MCR8547087.1 hypothetical protein [Salipiger pentaromativorans]